MNNFKQTKLSFQVVGKSKGGGAVGGRPSAESPAQDSSSISNQGKSTMEVDSSISKPSQGPPIHPSQESGTRQAMEGVEEPGRDHINQSKYFVDDEQPSQAEPPAYQPSNGIQKDASMMSIGSGIYDEEPKQVERQDHEIEDLYSGRGGPKGSQSNSRGKGPRHSAKGPSDGKGQYKSPHWEHLRALAADTLGILQKGSYIAPSGKQVDIFAAVSASLKGTQFYAADFFDDWETRPRERIYQTEIKILELPTLATAKKLAEEAGDYNTKNQKPVTVGVLNFASAKKPGGGFINGAKAQEESIARVSSLYESLMTHQSAKFYDKELRREEGAIYSDAMIYSPRVVVFNTDDRIPLETPYEISILTSPAVNAGVLRKTNEHQDQAKVEQTIERLMRKRMAKTLALFENRGDQWLVLGSYGTGVFANNVEMVAQIWADLLCYENSPFYGVFAKVHFGIVGGDRTLQRFRDILEPNTDLSADTSSKDQASRL